MELPKLKERMLAWSLRCHVTIDSLLRRFLGSSDTATDRYWRKARWKLLFLFVTTIAAVVGVGLFLGVVFRAQSWLQSAWSTPDLGLRLQIIGLMVNSILTSILVLATLAYVWLTRLTLAELTEGRRTGKRPVIAISLGKLHFDRDEPNQVWINCPMRVVNLGGAALFPTGEIVMPYRAPSDPSKAWLLEGIRTAIKGFPEVMESSSAVESDVRLLVEPYSIPESRVREFCELRLKFEDTERNLYRLTQHFDLFRHNELHTLSLKYEALSVLPFRRRQYVGDDSLGISYSGDTANWERLYERVGFL